MELAGAVRRRLGFKGAGVDLLQIQRAPAGHVPDQRLLLERPVERLASQRTPSGIPLAQLCDGAVDLDALTVIGDAVALP